jgi:hypothetical protein
MLSVRLGSRSKPSTRVSPAAGRSSIGGDDDEHRFGVTARNGQPSPLE